MASTNIPRDVCQERPLFGGAISSNFPLRFHDLSDIRQVPDNQETFADPSRDESLVFELLELKPEIEDGGSAVWFLRDLACEQDSEESMVLEHSSVVEAASLSVPAVCTTPIGQLIDSPSAHGRCGFVAGRMFNKKGELIVSLTQEALIRKKNQTPKPKL